MINNTRIPFFSFLSFLMVVFMACGSKTAKTDEQTLPTRDSVPAEIPLACDTLPVRWVSTSWFGEQLIDSRYDLGNLTDGNATTCLVMHPDLSEYACDFDQEVRLLLCADAQTIRTITFRNGYCKSDELFAKNSRVRQLLIYDLADLSFCPSYYDLEDITPLFEGDLADTPEPQTIALPYRPGLNAVVLVFRVNKIYPGTTWRNDICLSELTCLGEKDCSEPVQDTFQSDDLRQFFLQGHVRLMVDLTTNLSAYFTKEGRLEKASIPFYAQPLIEIERGEEGALLGIRAGGDGEYQGYSFSFDEAGTPTMVLYYYGDAGGDIRVVYKKGRSPLCPDFKHVYVSDMEAEYDYQPSVTYPVFDKHGNWLECKIDKQRPSSPDNPRITYARRLIFYYE